MSILTNLNWNVIHLCLELTLLYSYFHCLLKSDILGFTFTHMDTCVTEEVLIMHAVPVSQFADTCPIACASRMTEEHLRHKNNIFPTATFYACHVA